MKQEIFGFSQMYACSLQKTITKTVNGAKKETLIKIDITDLAILKWFVDNYSKLNKMVIENSEYVWVSYKKVLDELPILCISKQALSDRFQKLVEFKLLTFKLLKENGTYTLFGFGENFNKLLIYNSKSDKEIPRNVQKSIIENVLIEKYLNPNYYITENIDLEYELEELKIIQQYIDVDELKRYINKIGYKTYLQTPWWKITAKYKKSKIKKCQLCGSTKNLNVHHSNYSILGNEFNNLDELTVLCQSCHYKFHKGDN